MISIAAMLGKFAFLHPLLTGPRMRAVRTWLKERLHQIQRHAHLLRADDAVQQQQLRELGEARAVAVQALLLRDRQQRDPNLCGRANRKCLRSAVVTVLHSQFVKPKLDLEAGFPCPHPQTAAQPDQYSWSASWSVMQNGLGISCLLLGPPTSFSRGLATGRRPLPPAALSPMRFWALCTCVCTRQGASEHEDVMCYSTSGGHMRVMYKAEHSCWKSDVCTANNRQRAARVRCCMTDQASMQVRHGEHSCSGNQLTPQDVTLT
jgi:hypothetical protein